MKETWREEHSRKDKCKYSRAGQCRQDLGKGHEAGVAEVRAKKESVGGMWSEKTGLETGNKDNFPGSSAIKK